MQSYQPLLDQFIQLNQAHLADNLVGIYLHGSLAMTGFNPLTSDIDLIVLTQQEIPLPTKHQLIKGIIQLEENAPAKGLEISYVLAQFAQNFVYPTPFLLHYSITHKHRYQTDPSYLCENDTDPDLAAHFTILTQRGKTLFGLPIKKAFAPIPPEHYRASIYNDIQDALTEITKSPTYYTLNLCRVLAYLQQQTILSKTEAGAWALQTLPSEFHPLIQSALDSSNNQHTNNKQSPQSLQEFSQYMLKKIENNI
jgi:streptomycin 3"-adenylyltransferase